MATSGSFSTNQVKAGSRTWYWDFSWWVASWNGNTATINWNAYTRATSGTSGQSYVSNYGFSITVNGNTQMPGGNFYKDNQIASGSFTLGGGTSFSASITAHPYGGSYTSSGNSAWTLDNNITTPSCSCSITSISENSISASLTVTNNGNASITENTLQISTSSNFSSVQTVNGTTATWTGLSLNTQYYVRARVKNAKGYSSWSKSSTDPHTWNKPTISNVAVKNLIAGNSQTVTLSNSHNRNCTITVKDDSNNTLYTGSTTGTSLTFTIPADKCRLALGSGSSENKTPVNLTYTCSYSSWSTPYNTSPSCTLGINTTYKPTWNSNFDINAAITYRDTNSTSRNITGNPQILVRGKSKWAYSLALKGTQAAIKNSNSESNIKKYQISFNNFSDNNYFEITGTTVERTDLKGGTITSIGSGEGADVTSSSLSVSVRAVDCKGVASDIKTKTIPVTPYAVPTGTLTAKRQNNYGTTVELTINPTWAVSSRNAGTAKWFYRLPKASNWTEGAGTINQFNTPVALGVSFDNTLSYEFKVVLTDTFGGSSTAEIKAFVGPGMPIFFIDETVNGVGVNTIPTEQGLFVDGKTNIKGDLKVTNTINNTFNISVGNRNNYPYHRIAYTPVRTGNYIDNSLVLLLTAGYQGGPYGIVKCDLRTNNASGGGTAGASAIWLSRYGFSVDQVALGLKNTAADSYLDVFIKTSGTYNSIVVTPLFVGRRGAFDASVYTFCNSAEVDNTTTTDSLTSYESYNIISETASANKGPRTYTNVITAVDGGNVNFSNNIQVDTTNPTSGTNYYIPFSTGLSGSQRERANDGLKYYCANGTASVAGTGELCLGNETSTGTAGNKRGHLRLMSEKYGSVYLRATAGSTAQRWVTFPDLGGTAVVKQSDAITTDSNGWYKVNMGAFTMYYKNFEMASKSFRANGWGWLTSDECGGYFPRGVTFNSAKMAFAGTGGAGDPAILFSCRANNGAGNLSVTWQNTYNLDINAKAWFNYILIVFP